MGDSGGWGLIHILGLWDDRKALGPMFKLFVQLSITTALVLVANLRILTFLDSADAGRTCCFGGADHSVDRGGDQRV